MDSQSQTPAPHHAEPPRIPAATREFERAEAERAEHIRERRLLEGRSIVRGLILLAVAVVLASILRAGLGRVFPAGWWRP